jgi:hypothetical protein
MEDEFSLLNDFSVVTPLRGDRNSGRQHFLERPAMIGQPESHRRRPLVIAIHAIGKRQPQGPMSPMEVMVEQLQVHERIESGIPLSERVCLAGEGIEPIAQRPVEPFDMHGTSWLHLRAQHGADLHRQEAPMLIAMLDGLRQGQRLWDDQPGTSPLARAHGLSLGPYQDALVAMPAIAEPAERALVGPLDGAAHRLLKQLLTQGASGAGDHEATVAVLDQTSPALSLIRLVNCALFFCTEDQNSSIST